MYKFYMTGINLLIIPLFYSWEILLNKITRYRLYSFTFFVIGLYAFLARKMLFAFIITIVISFFIRKTIKWYYWIGLISISIVFYFNSDKIFGNYFQTTQSELNDEDFVRFKSTNYFLHYFDNSMCVFLGNGKDYEPSVYGKFISSLKESLGFYRSDIGVFAHFSYYGILGLIPIILFIIFILRKWEKIPFYIKLYFIYNLIQLPIAFPLNSVIGSFTFVIVIYLIELDFQKRLILNSQKRNEKFLKKKLLNNLDQNIKFPKLLI